MERDKKLFLLDAYALIYRAYYALNKRPSINSKGMNTSAILGFANTLFDLLQKEKPTHIAVVFDMGEPTTRTENFSAYKANREETPEDIVQAVPYIIKLIEAFNIPVLGVPGYEADDVIGTLAKKAELKGYTTYMMTPDKDFGQLVSEHIMIYKPPMFGNSSEILGVQEVCAKFQVDMPEKVIDILGLMGDAVDNIPGIPGVGEKTAIKLIQEFGSVEAVIANADQLKGKLKDNVINYANQALMSKQLATIILDAPIDFDEDVLVMQDIKAKELEDLCSELEFRRFAQRVLGKELKSVKGYQMSLFDPVVEETQEENTDFATADSTPHNYFLINTREARQKLIEQLKKQNKIAFDTETTGINPYEAELVGFSFSFKTHEGYYIPVSEDYAEVKSILEEFVEIWQDKNIEKIGQNIKFDLAILKTYGIEVKGKLFDTMVAHYLLEPELKHNMDYLAETYLNYKPISIEALIGKKGKSQLSMRSVALDDIKEYAAEDADITWQLGLLFNEELKKNQLAFLFEEVEMPLLSVLCDMEHTGVKVDIGMLADISFALDKQIKEEENEIYQLAGINFNISSPKQLGDVLFEVLKIDAKAKKTKTQQYSTGEDILNKYVNTHPIIQHILDYRSLTKLKSTYVDALPSLVNRKTGRIHTSYNQAVTATGRLSSNNPNLQNIPIRTDRGREIRKAFVPSDDNHVLISADYSQIELRIIAHLSRDKQMQAAFKEGEDIHTATAAKIFGVGIDEVDKEMRRKAKSINFGIVYGISAFGLSQQLNISRREAAEIIDAYFKQYPDIKNYMNEAIVAAKEKGYVETILKRRRFLRDINSANAIVRGFAERNAINAPIQGSSADMIKIAMIEIHRAIEEKGLKAKMILQVHDELVFDVPKDEVEIIKNIVDDKMKNALSLDVPLQIDINQGINWLEAH